MFFSFKLPRGANKCQAVPVHCRLLSPRPDKQGFGLARCPLPPLAALRPQAADRRSSQKINSCCDFGWATGQAAARHPAHTQGTWPWVNWQMPNIWVCLQSDVTLRVRWPYCTRYPDTYKTTGIILTLFPPFLSVFQALDQLYSTCNLPHSNHHGTNLMALAPGKACCNLCLITMFMWLDAVLQCAILKQVLEINVWFVTFSKEKIHSLH